MSAPVDSLPWHVWSPSLMAYRPIFHRVDEPRTRPASGNEPSRFGFYPSVGQRVEVTTTNCGVATDAFLVDEMVNIPRGRTVGYADTGVYVRSSHAAGITGGRWCRRCWLAGPR